MRFTETGSGRDITFTEAFLSEDIFIGKTLSAINVPRLPAAFFNNIGEMTASDVAFVVANQFFGQKIEAPVIRNLTSLWLSKFENTSNEGYSHLDSCALSAILEDILLKFFIQQGNIDPEVIIIDYGTACEINAALNFISARKILITTPHHSGDIIPSGIDGPIIFVRGRLSEDTRLVAKSVRQLKKENHLPLIMLTATNVTKLLTYVFLILDRARSDASSGSPLSTRVKVYNAPGNHMVSEAVSIASALGLPVEETLDKHDSADAISLDCMNIPNPGSLYSPGPHHEAISAIAPTVPLIKQSIVSYTTKYY